MARITSTCFTPGRRASSQRAPRDTGSAKPTLTCARCTMLNCTSMNHSMASPQKVPAMRIATEPAMPATVIAARNGLRSRLRMIMRCAGVSSPA